MTSNPINISQTFSGDPGVKRFFAQFKNGNQVSQVYSASITLNVACVQAPCPGAEDNGPIYEQPKSNNTSYSACGKSGYLAAGYTALTTCAQGAYLVVEQYGDRVEPSCRAIPPGFTRDSNDVCKVVSSTQTVPGNVCLSNPGYMCGDANGKTRAGKTCSNYQASLNAGCTSDNVYPYCFSGCN
jgi:hypothetical protein